MIKAVNIEIAIGEKKSVLDTIIQKRQYLYDEDKIPKKKGVRTIFKPHAELKDIQKFILKNILYNYDVHRNVHGFVPTKSTITNAIRHINKKIILKIDIHDFFPSITANRVYGFFKTLGYDVEDIMILTKLCTYKNQLPQGAPTSPCIANLICFTMDARLSGLARKNNLNYSRYADDMTFSGNKIGKKTIELIKKIILEEGFKLNLYKTKLLSQKNRQIVTGLILNDELSLGHKNFNSLKAKLHSLRYKIPEVENIMKYKKQLMGQISIYKQINPWQWYKLKEYFNKIDWLNYSSPHSENKRDQLVNEIEYLFLALNQIIGDNFRPTKKAINALKTYADNDLVFNNNMEQLHSIFTHIHGKLHFFYQRLSKEEKAKIMVENKLHHHNNIIKKYANMRGLNVSVLNDINILSMRGGRHEGEKLEKLKIKSMKKYEFNDDGNNHSWVQYNILKQCKIMLELLLKLAQKDA